MLGEAKIKEIAERVLALSTADQTEVVILGEENQLTRFANSYIHQNVAEKNAQIRVRAVVGRKIGVATTNDLSDEALAQAVESAIGAARLQRENPDFLYLPSPQPIPKVEGFVEATAGCTPKERAQAASIICRRATEKGLNASGALTTAAQEIAVANSLGVFAYYPTTLADLEIVIMADSGSGYAHATSVDVTQIDAQALGQEAIEKALRSRDPVEIDPGDYTVILEEHAVEEILFYLTYLGCGALAVQERRSFMTDRFGEKIVGRNISLWDDGLDPQGLPMPFDYEGVPKRKVDFIREGLATSVVYDTYTAGREKGKESTGHATLPAPNPYGPLAANRFMAAGQATKEEMLASTERGIWVTRFHYMNPVHRFKTIITGMTRDGTFLIEKGEITRPIKNLRFTQSILEALSSVEMIGKERKPLLSSHLGCGCVPALKVRDFTFTGVTEF
ncbi:MAG TPA: TldD/PmbA family protein [Chloroflexi bacterium]|nr:TldD/PmbA family protein [Chloroflexota bacterium]